MSRLVGSKPLDDKAAAGWTTYGTLLSTVLGFLCVNTFTKSVPNSTCRISIRRARLCL
jgi:hypothetical protein